MPLLIPIKINSLAKHLKAIFVCSGRIQKYFDHGRVKCDRVCANDLLGGKC